VPSLKVLERDWEKAIKIVERDYPDVEKGSDKFWALVFGVLKRMRGRRSARHLKYMGVLSHFLSPRKKKGEKMEKWRIEYLPYLVNPRRKPVSFSQLWLELPEELESLPPSAFPSLPAARGQLYATANKILEENGVENLTDKINILLSLYLMFPVVVKVDESDLEDLKKSGVVITKKKIEKETDSRDWKLLWMYGLMSGKIPPPTRNWALFLTRLHPDEYRFLLSTLEDELSDGTVKLDWSKWEGKGEIGFGLHPTYLVVRPSVAFSHRVLFAPKESFVSDGPAEQKWEWLVEVLGKVYPAALLYSFFLPRPTPTKTKKFVVLLPYRMTVDDFLCVATRRDGIVSQLPVIKSSSPSPEELFEITSEDELQNFVNLVSGMLTPFHF